MITVQAVPVIVADGNGVSVYTLEGIQRERLTGFAWRFRKGTPVPAGLSVVSDPLKKGHYVIAPVQNMPVDKYKGLLEELGLRCEKFLKIREDGSFVQVG